MVEKGANIHVVDALISASRNGHLEIVKYLVESGADIRRTYNVLIKKASKNGHQAIINYLKSLS